ncbi:gephyrin-like molybdotransferase Glp [Piscinibacterium candidicorallinum]|uniref:Molybdopterin molybdenumtransferase n=1 Tax=Piscinibacterium candidicorallinum TaxID=1793872 RepID=A0ABV7H4F7_9BURK
MSVEYSKPQNTPPKAFAPLTPVAQAIDRLRASATVVGAEQLELMRAAGRVLAQDVVAPINVPPHDNSAMDGYVLRLADALASAEQGVVMPVSQRIAAGHAGAPLAAGTAARIFTGAPIPEGGELVVPQELTETSEAGVRLLQPASIGQHIRRAGEDIALGNVLVPAGTRLTAAHLGLIASVGQGRVTVRRRLRVAVFSTGDELRMPGEPLGPGQIYNSNRFVHTALLAQMGHEVTDLGIVRDSLDATRAALREAAQGHDLIITCGGVSVGEEDHVKAAVQAEGELTLWSLAIKPGKPLAHGTVRRADGTSAQFIGLPGNPVSSFVTLLIVVAPLFMALLGEIPREQALYLRADFAWPKPDQRQEFLRVRMNSTGGLELYPNQGSGVLTSCAWADGFVDNPGGRAIAHGDVVRFLPLSGLLGLA